MRERLFLVLMYAVLGAFALFCFIPFWIVFINSFADESLLQTAGTSSPSKFSLHAYKFLLSGKQVFLSYGITIIVTIAGTALGVLLSAYAYTLSHRKVKYRHILSF